MAAILSIGEDAFLLETRAAVLRRTGAEVVNTNIVSALSYLETRCFDLVILCHSIPIHLCRTLGEIIQLNWPATRLMHLSTLRSWEQSEIQAGVDICAPEPEQLLEHTILLLGRRSPSGVKAPIHVMPIRTNFVH
jgi:hypothetical protein